MTQRAASESMESALTDFQQAVCNVLLNTVPGDVLTYGDVAEEAGYPAAARAVGSVLKRVEGLPWWTVVSANGRLVPHNVDRHSAALRAEGVTISGGRVVAPPK